jgi:large subunit ribosomal protein L32e
MVYSNTNVGIDNRMRRKFRGNKKMPKIGYGSDKKTRFFCPNKLKKFVVHNIKDLDVLLMNNRTFCAEIAHNVSAKKKAEIVKRAQQIRVKVTNARAKVRAEEKKPEA